MKRLIALLVCILCVLGSLMACGGEMPAGTSPSDTTPADSNPDTSPDDTTPDDTTPPEIVEDIPVTNKADIMKMKDGAKGVISFVLDDGFFDTVDFLNGELEKNNLRATIGMIATRVISTEGVKNEANIQRWQSYLDTGRFDIACHSYTHKFWGITDKAETGTYLKQGTTTVLEYSTKDGNITFETQGARDALRDCFPGQRVLAFIKPGFGQYIDENGKKQSISPEGLELVKKYFIGMRVGGKQTQTWSVPDYYNLASYQVGKAQSLTDWTSQVDAAVKYGKWLTFMFHEVVPDSQIDKAGKTLPVRQSTTSDLMAYVGDKVANGELWCAFYEEALLYAQEQRVTSGTVKTYSERIEVSLTHKLDAETFNYPLTVRVKVPAEWTSVVLTHADGTTETLTPFVEKDVTYVYANVVPDGQVAVLRNAE